VTLVATGRIRPSVRAETTIYRARTRRRRRQTTLLAQRAAVVLVVLVGVVAIVGLVFAGSASKLAGGTTVGGLDVGGLTPQQAIAKLGARERALSHVRVAFVADGTTTSYSASQLGVQADWAAAVAQAQQHDSGFWPVRAFRRLVTSISGYDVTPRLRSYPFSLRYGVTAIARKVDTKHRDASLVRHGLRIAVVPGQPGRTLDRVAAERAVVAALGAAQRPTRVALPVKVEPPTVTAAQLAPVARKARLALSAPVRLTYGGTTWRLPRWRIAPLLHLPSGGSTTLAIGGPAATDYFRKLAIRVDRKPVDATFRILSGNGVAVVPSKPGVALDTARTAKALLAAALTPANRIARLAVGVDAPARSTQDAQKMGITGLVSSFETTYGGTPGRLHNVALVAKLIDGTLIAPGAVFSFNDTTGARTADKGFEVAPVIINGELQNGLGGGVCQVSTTTFNAAFFAGLPILERTNHALYISHYPQGRDATVDYPSIDLKFRNDTNAWLLLRTFVGTGSLTVALYGTPQHRRVEYQTAPLVVTGAMPVKQSKDPSLKPGEQVVDQAGAPPRSTSVQRLVYDAGGKLLYDTTWRSTYDAETELVRVGVKKKPKPKPPVVAGPATRVT
jgi:vancomycin resistance protein YoaR